MQSMGLQRSGQDLATEQKQHSSSIFSLVFFFFFLRNLHAVFYSGCAECHCYEIAVHWYFVITEYMKKWKRPR